MPQYSSTAFRWSGTGYNAQYNTSYTAVLDDDDGLYQGSGDGNETISINGGSFNPSLSTPYAINVSFTDTSGNFHIEEFYFFNTSGPPSGWYFIPGPGSAFTVGATLGSYQSHTSSGWSYSSIACFSRNTLIQTSVGETPIQDICIGDLVQTQNHGLKPVLWAGSSKVAGRGAHAPIRICKGALGNNRALRVSPQHRMLIEGWKAELLFGEDRLLVPAKHLVNGDTIFRETMPEIEYFHIMFDQHEVIYAEGCGAESFLLNDASVELHDMAAREELLALFPELVSYGSYGMDLALPTISGREAAAFRSH